MDQSMLHYRDSLCAISINISRLLAMLGIVPVVCPYEDMESNVCQYVIHTIILVSVLKRNQHIRSVVHSSFNLSIIIGR